jgi:predicted nucleotidyltransferase
MEISVQNKIALILSKQTNIKFAYIFGSALKNKTRYGSDLDIALYFENEPDLLTIGELAIQLEKEVEKKIDLIMLNNLDKSNPCLAYSVLSKGIVVYTRDENTFKEFKRSVLLHYLDFKYVRDMFDTAFNKRLSSNKFAVFDK